jgi:hypothetical protein
MSGKLKWLETTFFCRLQRFENNIPHYVMIVKGIMVVGNVMPELNGLYKTKVIARRKLFQKMQHCATARFPDSIIQ